MAGMRDGTGIAAVYGHPRAARVAARCVRALSHRGGGTVGLVVTQGETQRIRHGADRRLLDDEAALDALFGHIAVAQSHGPSGEGSAEDPWASSVDLTPVPAAGRLAVGPVAIAVAGEITNADALRAQLLESGTVLRGDGLAELLVHLVARSAQRTPVNRLVDALWQVRGAFAVLMSTSSALIAVRDPHGLRPLVLARLDGAVIAVSEEVAAHEIGAQVMRHVAPGEMVVTDARGIVQVQPFMRRPHALCVQELVQLARLGSTVDGWSVHQARTSLGEAIAQERAVADAQVVVALDAASVPAALGYARVARVPFEQGLVVERAGQAALAMPEVVAGRRVVVVAASIGSGAELRQPVAALTRAGAVAVHVRVASPRLVRACPYGVEGPGVAELEEALPASPGDAARALGATSVSWLSAERLAGAIGASGERDVCTGCLGGDFPVPPEAREEQLVLFDAEAPSR